MPVYVYKAMTKTGQAVKNRVEDNNRISLIKKIKRNGLAPISVTQVKTGRQTNKRKANNSENMENILKKVRASDIASKNGKNKVSIKDKVSLYIGGLGTRIKPRDVMVFTQNFYLLKKANFNNIHALSTIIESTDNLELRSILEEMLSALEAGGNMYVTMENYSNIFPPIYVNIVKVGELSGSLTSSLEQAITYLDESNAMSKKIKGILVPNLIQFGGIFLMLILGTIFAIPAIQDVFDKVGSTEELPEITMWFSGIVDVLLEFWYIPTFIIAGITIAIYLYISTPKGKYNFHYFKYTMPIFGKLIYALDFERLMRAILLNIKNGMRIQEALEVSKNVAKNYVMLSMIETSINNILIGQSWIEPFERSGLSSTMITEMLKIGMQTDLAEMMEKLLEYMQIDIDNIIQRIMKVLPQVVTIFVGIVLIFFVIVVLVPIIQVYMGNFLFSAAGV